MHPANSKRSLWLQEALGHDTEDACVLEGDARADVCIVGGGYTGLWTALLLKEHEPSLDVVILEADVCGSGASGRNGGFLMSWWSKFTTLKKLYGTDEASRLASASADAVTEIASFCSEHGIDAHLRPDGWMWSATNAAQVGAWKGTLAMLERAGFHPFKELEQEEARSRSGSPKVLAGVLESVAATVQPAKLARGLRRVALEHGVRIFEHSPVNALGRSRPPYVCTPSGRVTAECVVIATNAWASRIRELRRNLVVIASDMVATPPIPDRLRDIGLTDGLAISDSRMLINYYRTTPDGRIAFGKAGGALALGGRIGSRFQGASPRASDVQASMHALYPMLGDVSVTSSWTGPIDRSPHGLPFFGNLGGRPYIVYGVGYSGNGVGPTYLGGRILAALALRLEDEWSECGLARRTPERFPAAPICYLGGQLVRAAVARQDKVEDAGRKPDRLTARLAALAPSGGLPTRGKE